jgi:tRNA pseudouridine55 synthase
MSSGISLHKCLTFDDIVRYTKEGTLQSKLLSVDEAVDYLPAYTIAEITMKRAMQGQTIDPQYLTPSIEQGVELLRLYGPNQQFLGIFRLEENRGVRPVKVFHP